MLKITSTLGMLLLGALAQAQVSETRETKPFSRISVSDGIEVAYTEGETQRLTAFAHDELSLNDIVTEVKDSTLFVYTKEKLDTHVKINITANGMEQVKVGDHCIFSITNELHADKIYLKLTSGGIFSGNIQATSVRLLATSGSVFNGNVVTDIFFGNFRNNAKVRISGEASEAYFGSNSGAQCQARTFYAKKASMDAEGYSTILASAEEIQKVTVDENSTIKYCKPPQQCVSNSEATTNTNVLSRL